MGDFICFLSMEDSLITAIPAEGGNKLSMVYILDEWNGYPESFSFSQVLEISRQYLLLRTVILRKKVAGCP